MDEPVHIVEVTADATEDPLVDGVRTEALGILAALDLDERSELSLLLVGDQRIQELNRTWREIDRPTDVLSFAQDADAGLLGDVVINLDAVRRQSEEHGLGPQEELRLLLIHGILHLLGWNHDTPAERERMEAEEQRVWKEVGGTGSIR